MKKIMIGLATAGLLLGTGAAFSQNTERSQSGSTTSPGATQSQPAPSGSQSAPSGGREGGTATQSGGERRDGNRGERSGERGGDRTSTTVRGSGEREGMRVRERGERSSVNVRIRGGGDGYRHRRGHHIGVYTGGCRTIIIKKRYHGRTVIKRIRRCG
jgi:hypothetical protein